MIVSSSGYQKRKSSGDKKQYTTIHIYHGNMHKNLAARKTFSKKDGTIIHSDCEVLQQYLSLQGVTK